jgi:hypothetical protein
LAENVVSILGTRWSKLAENVVAILETRWSKVLKMW